jgi:RNA polymerase sigma-70 factor (ECF subfamily)
VIGAVFGARLAEAQGGDEEAFACLYRDIQPVLLRYLRVIAPGGAEDVAAEAWLRVVAGLAGFSGGELVFRGWVLAIARRLASGGVGRSADGRGAMGAGGRESVTPLIVPGDVGARPRWVSVHNALALLAALPVGQAEIILLCVVAGLDIGDVARIVGMSPGEVRMTGRRALRELTAAAGRAGVTR